MAPFAEAEERWIRRLGNLRNTVRQEIIARQLAEHVLRGSAVLDVGCGQGTQALRLAGAGCRVTGVDPSPELLERFRRDAASAGLDVEALLGDLDGLDLVLGDRTFDVVCAHGVLMYLDDVPRALSLLAGRVRPGGLLSVTVRNADGLASRAGMRGDWAAALAAFDADSYVNELGVTARADRTDALLALLAATGLEVVAWYGVRVFTDAASPDAPPPVSPELDLLLEAEYQAGRRDPYRRLASQTHVIATRPVRPI